MQQIKSNIRDILEEVIDERVSQDTKWGIQNHPSLSPELKEETYLPNLTNYYLLPSEKDAKNNCEIDFKNGNANWASIAVEELCEVIESKDEKLRREELIQLAAVVFAWIECIDRNKE